LGSLVGYSKPSVFSPLVVNVFKVESVNVTREITQQRKEDVDTKIDSAPRDQEDSERWDEDLLR
jgi:hypothetical protein